MKPLKSKQRHNIQPSNTQRKTRWVSSASDACWEIYCDGWLHSFRKQTAPHVLVSFSHPTQFWSLRTSTSRSTFLQRRLWPRYWARLWEAAAVMMMANRTQSEWVTDFDPPQEIPPPRPPVTSLTKRPLTGSFRHSVLVDNKQRNAST